jgi:UDP:flavonoid glycosyltransferase YjiC (YdhE family)
VPSVVSPLATDQFDTATQEAAARVGVLAGSGAPSPDGVRDAVRMVRANPPYRESTAAIATPISAMPPPDHILDRLYAFANRA